MSDRPGLEEARRELVRLGYLSHRFERFLLQDALVARGPGRGVAVLAAKVGVAAGALIATINTIALALANGLFATAPRDVIALFLHVAPPVALGTALGFLAVVIAFRLFLAAFPRRGLELARVGSALVAAAAVVAIGLWLGWEFLVGLPRVERALLGALLPLVAGGVAKLVADGLLAVEIRWIRSVPHERLVPRRVVAGSIAVSVAVVAVAGLLLSPRARAPEPVPLPVAPGERVLLVGVDGVMPDELEFLLGRGDLPELARLAREGGVVAAYGRDEASSPATFWTSVATGREARGHGVESLDGFRLLGAGSTLARTGPWRLYFANVSAPLGLASQRALLSSRRRAPALWELVARGGRPAGAVDWWSTFPADPDAGVVVAHGAWELLGRDETDAVQPPATHDEILALRRSLAAEPRLLPGVAPALARRLDEQALAADRFYREVARRLAPRSRALALYLPAADLAAGAGGVPPGALAAVVREELRAADALVGEIGAGFGAVAWLFDPGRRGGGEGRVLLWTGACRAESRPRVDPRQVAALLLRVAGLPQSRELPAPPEFCAPPPASGEVASYGERRPPARAGAADADYLETLRSLGYL